MKHFYSRAIQLLFLLLLVIFSQAQTIYTSATNWTVPANVTAISIKVYGGGGGTGGQDCGAGCTNAAAGNPGYVVANYTVSGGNIIGIYPGGKGANGANSSTSSGGGAGGTDTYPSANYNGGNGGNAGNSGTSGGGGGGGAASVITINSTIRIVAGGAGGGGGMANMANSGYNGNSTTSSNGVTNGGNGTVPSGDGGGGGGGGGGLNASSGGGVHSAGGESGGDGGYRGGNSVSGAISTISNTSIAWTSAGRVEITIMSTLPVTWLDFSAIKQGNHIALKWSTAMEQNTKDYDVQRSSNAADWNSIGTVTAAGISTTEQQYSFIDQYPVNGINYYRLLQRDINGNNSYSKVILLDFGNDAGKLKIYPNPVTNGNLSFVLKGHSLVKIYNSSGLTVLQKQLQAGRQSLNVSHLAPGIYYLRTGDEQASFKIQ